MDPPAIVRRRMREQRLVGEPFDSPHAAVRFLGAVQGQEFADAKWALGQRLDGWTDAEVERAFAEGEILRTHTMRPTWHLIAPQDIVWIQRLTGPRVHAAMRSSYRRLGLDDDVLRRAHEVIARTLADGEPRLRRELGEALSRAGIEAGGQRLAHIAAYAEVEGLICSGPRRGKQHTYALLADRAPAAEELTREQALAELTRRYYRSHGPATVRDFAWWSGLTVADVRAGLAAVADELAERLDEFGTTWFSAPQPTDDGEVEGARLLSVFDESVIAYKDLRIALADGRAGAGETGQPLTIDGVAVGTWKRRFERHEVAIEVALHEALSAAGERALAAEAERLGSFFELPVRLEARPPG